MTLNNTQIKSEDRGDIGGGGGKIQFSKKMTRLCIRRKYQARYVIWRNTDTSSLELKDSNKLFDVHITQN